MSRVFVSEGTRAVIYVFADDHCPRTFTPGTGARVGLRA